MGPAYDEVYVSGVVKVQGKVFYIIRDELPGVDEKWFITLYMRSHIRAMLDVGNPKFVNMPAREVISRFIEDECGNAYKRGESWGGFLPEWVGKIYALYQWKYNVKSKDLIINLPLLELERVFPTLHQTGWESAVDKIHELLQSDSTFTV